MWRLPNVKQSAGLPGAVFAGAFGFVFAAGGLLRCLGFWAIARFLMLYALHRGTGTPTMGYGRRSAFTPSEAAGYPPHPCRWHYTAGSGRL